MSIVAGLIQTAPGPDPEKHLLHTLEAAEMLIQKGSQLIILPELSFQPFFPRVAGQDREQIFSQTIPGDFSDRLRQFARRHGVVLICNLYEKSGDRYFDTSPVIDADGRILGKTRMVHIMQGPGFFERDYYDPGDLGAPVFDTAVGRVGVAICYDRHFPEYMRALGVQGAEIVAIPQAGAVGEWPPGVFEAEMQVASMQNGYFCLLANRVGREGELEFAGESFVTDPMGQVIGRAASATEDLLTVELDLTLCKKGPARRHFLPDRRPEAYPLDDVAL